MTEQIPLAEAFDAPATAQLAIHENQIALIVVRHEDPDRITIERKRLGTVVDLAALQSLVQEAGSAPAAPPVITVQRVAAPQLEDTSGAAVRTGDLCCPECGKAFRNTAGLGGHRRTAHGVAAAPPRPTELPAGAGVTCEQCGRQFKNEKAVRLHRIRTHRHETVEPETPVDCCEECGQPTDTHGRCADCGVLVGVDHQAGSGERCQLCISTDTMLGRIDGLRTRPAWLRPAEVGV